MEKCRPLSSNCCKTCSYALLIVLTIQSRVSAAATKDRFITYRPVSDVASFATVDQDQRSIEAQLALSTDQGMEKALEIYRKGGPSTDDESSIQSFSTNAEAAMLDCKTNNCPIPTYKSFHDYYGAGDYADKWIMAAFQNDQTQFLHGNVNFSSFGIGSYEARGEFVRIGTLVLNIWMRLVWELYHAVDYCDVHRWDQAVALYVGSGSRNGARGNMFYTLAKEHCSTFGTCESTSDEAKVNRIILEEFQHGQTKLQSGQCAATKTHADKIVAFMTVPLLQGFLSSALDLDRRGDTRDTTKAQVLAYGVSLIPLLNKCDGNFAQLVQINLPYQGTTSTSFEVIKDAVERSYDCLGITCQDVGGFVDLVHVGQYLPGAEPCAYQQRYSVNDSVNIYGPSSSDSEAFPFSAAAISVLVVVVTLLVFIAVVLCIKHRAPAHKKEFDTAENKENDTTKEEDDIENDVVDSNLPEVA